MRKRKTIKNTSHYPIPSKHIFERNDLIHTASFSPSFFNVRSYHECNGHSPSNIEDSRNKIRGEGDSWASHKKSSRWGEKNSVVVHCFVAPHFLPFPHQKENWATQIHPKMHSWLTRAASFCIFVLPIFPPTFLCLSKSLLFSIFIAPLSLDIS